MKKLLFYSVCLLVMLASCKKNKSVAPSNTITATVGGTTETFNKIILAQLSNGLELGSSLIISAASSGDENADGMSIVLNLNNSITNQAYTNTGNFGEVSVTYVKGPTSFVNPNAYSTDPNGTYLTTVTITSLSNTNVQGTFSGQLLFSDGKTVKSVTNGKFNVNLSQGVQQ